MIDEGMDSVLRSSFGDLMLELEYTLVGLDNDGLFDPKGGLDVVNWEGIAIVFLLSLELIMNFSIL